MPRKISRTRRSQNHASAPFNDQQHTQNFAELENEEINLADMEMMSLEQGPEAVSFEHGERRHEAGKRDVELYIRTYNTLLRSSGEVNLKALVQTHLNIDSSLHPDAHSPYPDMSALIYSVLRLPASVVHCNLVLLGQAEEMFLQQGFCVNDWQRVTASARRRKWFYDGDQTLAAYVASVSDTDDIIPVLVAFQIEWNKMYYLLNADPTTRQFLETRMEQSSPVFAEISKVLSERLHIAQDDWRRLEVIWGENVWDNPFAYWTREEKF